MSHPRIVQPAASVISVMASGEPHCTLLFIKFLENITREGMTNNFKRPRCFGIGCRKVVETFALEAGLRPVVEGRVGDRKEINQKCKFHKRSGRSGRRHGGLGWVLREYGR